MLQAQNPRGLLVHTAPDEHVPHGAPPISLRSPKHHLHSSLGKSCAYFTLEHIHCATDSTIGYGEEYQEQHPEAQPIPDVSVFTNCADDIAAQHPASAAERGRQDYNLDYLTNLPKPRAYPRAKRGRLLAGVSPNASFYNRIRIESDDL